MNEKQRKEKKDRETMKLISARAETIEIDREHVFPVRYFNGTIWTFESGYLLPTGRLCIYRKNADWLVPPGVDPVPILNDEGDVVPGFICAKGEDEVRRSSS